MFVKLEELKIVPVFPLTMHEFTPFIQSSIDLQSYSWCNSISQALGDVFLHLPGITWKFVGLFPRSP